MSGSLPHRQQKMLTARRNHDPRSLPHRQLRKDNAVVIGERGGSLPHRQQKSLSGTVRMSLTFAAAQAA